MSEDRVIVSSFSKCTHVGFSKVQYKWFMVPWQLKLDPFLVTGAPYRTVSCSAVEGRGGGGGEPPSTICEGAETPFYFY